MNPQDFIPVAEPWITEEDARAVYETVQKGWISMGKKVAEFEKDIAIYTDSKHAIAVYNGTAALHVALAAMGVGPGDEVIVPSLTYISSANAVLYTGAQVVLCECNPGTYLVEPEHVEPLITEKTKVILPVDMNGLPVDYTPLLALANSRGIHLLLDSAESLGARYRSMPVGAQAHAHIFSMFPNKSITTGEGGIITTDDDQLAARIRLLRNQGQEARYHHVALGFNYRMTEMQAALGVSQLKRIEMFLKLKRAIVTQYNELLAPHADLIRPPALPPHVSRHSWFMYAISLADSIDRDAVVRHMSKHGIDTRLGFPPIHIQPYYRETFGYKPEDFPVSLKAYQQLIDLPISPKLKPEQIQRVADTLIEAVRLCSR